MHSGVGLAAQHPTNGVCEREGARERGRVRERGRDLLLSIEPMAPASFKCSLVTALSLRLDS